jgi:putative redox protein
MKIKLKNIYDSHSIIENETGNSILIDNKTSQNPKGVSPMELLLMGVAGCSSIDIISILKKQKQKFENLTIEVEGIREKR